MITFGKRNTNDDIIDHWEPLDINNYKITKPTILVFGGNNTDRPKAANGYAKIIEGLIPKIDKSKYDLVSFCYENEILNDRFRLSNNFDQELDYYFEQIFLPIFLNEFGKLNSIQKISKSLQQITFVAHCAGCEIVDYLLIRAYLFLKEINLSDGQIKNIFSKIQFVGYSPSKIIDLPISALYISPFHDDMPTWPNALEFFSNQKIDLESPKNIVKTFQKSNLAGPVLQQIINDRKALFLKLGNSVLVIPGTMINENYSNHSFKCLSSFEKNSTKPEMQLAEAISNIVSQTLYNFLNNSIKATNNNQQQIDMRTIYKIVEANISNIKSKEMQ